MPFSVNSYATVTKGEKLVPYKLERRDVATNDVLIDILYAGVCHTDLHIAHGDWAKPNLPLVTGHEIVGVVAETGPDVKNTTVGEIVAVGCRVDSCGSCQQCEDSHEMYCVTGSEATYNAPERRWPGHFTAGGYSEAIVVQEHFVLKVPKALQEPTLLRGVAPILCAGITTYSPLRQNKIGKGSKVAIVGLGGLGQMGVKLARALGAEVTAISRSHSKDSHAKELGAQAVVASTSEEEMKSAAQTFDLVIDTIPFEHDVNTYLPLVKPYGELSLVGHIGLFEKNPVNTVNLIFGNKRLSGSLIGGIKDTQELLELCAEHKIISEYELVSMDAVNDAWKKLESGDGAARYIIDIKAFRDANKA